MQTSKDTHTALCELIDTKNEPVQALLYGEAKVLTSLAGSLGAIAYARGTTIDSFQVLLDVVKNRITEVENIISEAVLITEWRSQKQSAKKD
jgi:hypothetical protein